MNRYTLLPQVERLLGQYDEYKKVHAATARVASSLARAKIKQLPVQDLVKEYEELQVSLQQISDDMTFDSPLIWIQYKYEAYKEEAQPILTMQDLRAHCSKAGYICTKRFTFLNDELRSAGLSTLDDALLYPDTLSLEVALASESLRSITADEDFMHSWRTYEYCRDGDRVAKWENYSSKYS